MTVLHSMIFPSKAKRLQEQLWQRPEDVAFEDLLQALLFCGLGTEKNAHLSRALAELARTPKGLFYLDPETVASIPGMGEARVSAVAAAVELARRQYSGDWVRGRQIDLNYIARHLKAKLEGLGKEYFYLFSFNRSFGLIQEHVMARGNADAVNVYYRDIAKTLLNDRAYQTLIAHNHPDESAVASPMDQKSMCRLDVLLEEMGIALIDQYIVGMDGVYSCKEESFIIPAA